MSNVTAEKNATVLEKPQSRGSKPVLRLATRGSKLALVQANLVKDALEELGASIELVTVTTKGDRDQKSPLAAIGGRGLFVREVEQALLDGTADLAVHSGKDLPYHLAEGLVIAGVPKAAPSGDVLLSRPNVPAINIIGTSSPRRELECRKLFPDAQLEPIRGNVDTRLRKLRDGQYDAIVLAEAGLVRLGADLSDLEVRRFTPEEFLPAACQGILAVECRAEDEDLFALLGRISDPESKLRFTVERYMFSLLEADCSVPLGVHCEVLDATNASAEFASARLRVTAMYNNKKATREGDDYKTLCDSLKQELMT